MMFCDVKMRFENDEFYCGVFRVFDASNFKIQKHSVSHLHYHRLCPVLPKNIQNLNNLEFSFFLFKINHVEKKNERRKKKYQIHLIIYIHRTKQRFPVQVLFPYLNFFFGIQ